MKLATTTDVLKRTSMNSNLSGSVSSAEAGLDAATILISNLLETDMQSVEAIDYFSPSAKQLGNEAKLYLARMFVNPDEIVEVSYGTYTGDVTTEEYTVVEPAYYSLDYTSGILKLDSVPTYGNRTVKVKYSSGFAQEADSRVPDWLKEAAISSAIYVMHTQVAAHAKQDILDISPEYRRMVYSMVQQHLRPRLNCMFADQSVFE